MARRLTKDDLEAAMEMAQTSISNLNNALDAATSHGCDLQRRLSLQEDVTRNREADRDLLRAEFNKARDTAIALRDDRDRLAAENQRMREDAAKVLVEEMHFDTATGFTAVMQTPLGMALCEFARATMRETQAENFVSAQFRFGDDKGAYYITIGRADGKSVDMQYQAACQERRRLAVEVAARFTAQEVADWLAFYGDRYRVKTLREWVADRRAMATPAAHPATSAASREEQALR